MNNLLQNLGIVYALFGGLIGLCYFTYWLHNFGEWLPAAFVIFLVATIMGIAMTIDEST